MLTVIQRVSYGRVEVDSQTIGSIENGIVALIAIEKGDTLINAKKLLKRLLNYRIFDDENGKMNRSLIDINGGVLLIPQFTLAADTKKGNRPSFASSAPPSVAQPLFEKLCELAQSEHDHVSTGQFGADMNVSLCNIGPITFTLTA